MAKAGSLRDHVRERAGRACEYGRLPEEFVSTPFQLDHIISEKHQGLTTAHNLAWCCLHCNSFKGPNIAGRDEATNHTVRLFNPRTDDWRDHFAWHGAVLLGRTPIGRATVAVLRINLSYRVALRESLIEEGVYPIGTPRSTKTE
jgi:hypothetical protein